MAGSGDEEVVEGYLMDAINQDSTANYQQFGVEEAQAADSFLNMSRDGIKKMASLPRLMISSMFHLRILPGYLSYMLVYKNLIYVLFV